MVSLILLNVMSPEATRTWHSVLSSSVWVELELLAALSCCFDDDMSIREVSKRGVGSEESARSFCALTLYFDDVLHVLTYSLPPRTG